MPKKLSKTDRIKNILWDNIESEHSIRCSKCNYIGKIINYSDEWDAVDEFYNKGWRTGKTFVYCPSCAKKYLKNV